MNYIRSLQGDLATARATLDVKDGLVEEFRAHLAGLKFHGLDLDGGRKDWIAVSDVLAWLSRITEAEA
jgi:hypothetical protein